MQRSLRPFIAATLQEEEIMPLTFHIGRSFRRRIKSIIIVTVLAGLISPARAQDVPAAPSFSIFLPNVTAVGDSIETVDELTLDLGDTPARRLSGGPLQWAGEGRPAEQSVWYLPADGRLIGGDGGGTYGFAEPFPLDPKLEIRDIAYEFPNEIGTGLRGLVAATNDGIYLRNWITFRWSKISNRKAQFISACAARTMWIVPDENPNQLLVSHDDGATWKDVSQGLRGRIASNLFRGMFCQDFILTTVYRGRYEIYRNFDSEAFPWELVGTVPGRAFAASTGLPASIAGGSDTEGHFLYAGSSDGNIYRPKFDPVNGGMLLPIQWEILQSFGPGKYPLFVNQYELSVVDTRTSRIQYYRAPGASEGISGNFQPVAFPTASLPWGAALLPDGTPAKRRYSAPFSAADINLTLGMDNSLWANKPLNFQINGGGGGGGQPVTRTVANLPAARQNLIVADYPNELGNRLLYSGATLTRTLNNTCAFNETGLYRSSDYGLTWTEIASGTARQPIAALKMVSGDPENTPDVNDVLVSTCTGPQLSRDGGSTWITSTGLGWPANASPMQWTLRQTVDGFGNSVVWNTLYATGILSTGVPFVLRGDLDLQPGMPVSITWTNITPISMTLPGALAISTRLLLAPDWCGEPPCGEAPPDVPLTLSSREIYVADGNTVWASLDDGATWQSLAEGLAGATVRAITSMNTDSPPSDPREVLMVATDRGLFIRPRPDKLGPWIPTTQRYSLSPQALFLFNYPLYTLNAADGVFDLSSNFFAYVAPPAPQLATCSNLVLNGGFEMSNNWTLPVTPASAVYSSERAYTGTRSLRMGIIPTGTNRLSYSTVYQFVTLPSDALTLTLQARVWRGATDIDPDLQWMEINDVGAQANQIDAHNEATTSDPIEQLRHTEGVSSVNSAYIFRTQSNAQSWEDIAYDLRNWRGKRMRLLAGIYNNGARGKSVMYADEIVIESCR